MKRKTAFAAVLIALLLCGILRSTIATRLDSFDLDEAYHVTAGVTYARLGDYRLNPEHPPTSEVVGWDVSISGYLQDPAISSSRG